MFGLRNCGIFALVVVFVKLRFDEVFALSSRVKYANEASGTGNRSGGQHSVECSDCWEVPQSKERDFRQVKNINSSKQLIINKCCGWDYYFDVDNFTCAPLAGNPTDSALLAANIGRAPNEVDHVFVEKVPGCGDDSVMSVLVTSRASVGEAGVAVDGEGVFSEYCVDRNSRHPLQAVVLACFDAGTFCRTKACFRKCCPLGYSYGPSGRKCQKANAPFKPKFYDLKTLGRADPPNPSQYGVYLGDACGAKGKYLLERDLGEVSYLGLDGTLFAPAFDSRRSFANEEFCVEFVQARNESGVESFLCFSKTGSHFENSQLQFFLLSLGFIISCMFLLLTFLVYLFSSKSQNLYGKTLMCYIGCLFAAYLCLAVIELKSKELDKGVCTIMGYSLLFSFLAAFFWLNVMSFDIWKTFRVDRTVDRSNTEKGRLQFIWYSLYAWGFPSAITAACAYLNEVRDFPYEALRPDIGEENCWFSKKRKGIYLFFITPISLVITLNVIFYVRTARKIWKVKSDVKKMDRQKTKKFSANKEQFLINGKLFIVMGITWSLEIISFFAPHPIWYVTDAANALHGVFIFAVFVLKKKVLRQVSEHVRAPLKKMRQLTTFDSDDLSRKKNVSDSNTEGRTYATGAFASKSDSKKF